MKNQHAELPVRKVEIVNPIRTGALMALGYVGVISIFTLVINLVELFVNR